MMKVEDLVFRDITKAEHDAWEHKYKLPQVASQLYSLGQYLLELDRKLDSGEITEEAYKRQYKIKVDIMNDLKRKYLEPQKEGDYSPHMVAMAAKLEIGVVNPKLTKEEWLKQPYQFFDSAFSALEDYQIRDMYDSDSDKIEKIKELLSEYSDETIRVSEVIELINNVNSLTLKKK